LISNGEGSFVIVVWLLVINGALFGLEQIGWARRVRAPLERVSVPIQEGLTGVGRRISGEFSRPLRARTLAQRYQALRDQYDTLIAENAKLRLEVVELEDLAATRRVNPKTKVIQAGVIEFGGKLVVDKGSDDGVAEGSGVVLGSNFIGKVSSTTPHTSVVSLVTDPSVKLAAMVVPKSGEIGSERVRGLAVGRFNQEVELTQVLVDEPMAVGELVVTAGGVGVPKHFIIGEIVEVRQKEAEVFNSARVKPLVNFKRIGSVSVVVES
jgi:rod shape-determining protein MreC